ncbi:hypothetical protein [Thalassotalea profundi]|uniref:Uncharacterized protein n=1 Tax=Thalassotalea profundi TaxID=2036687 RepID=A0ABQ3IMH6_9GAMM|nr:hypothetical protein [Thalassotalea profundi]GHE83894.1 hypothetical protein GCM10011501_10720 [Thalassotalea profundi]
MEYKKHFLQKIAKIVGIICTITAIGCAIYLMTILDSENKVLKGSIGATTFFFFMLGLVLNVISSTNLPNLKIDKDDLK